MPTVTHDGRSFLVDGRRVWLASGSISYSRVPRESWRDRVHAAKSAGLNCVDIPIFWNRHEPRPNKFDFKGDNDLRHFIEIVGIVARQSWRVRQRSRTRLTHQPLFA